MADKHFHPHTLPKSSSKIRRVELKSTDEIELNEDQKILRLKQSPKASERDIPKYIERRDSDEVLEVIQLDESPSNSRIIKETQKTSPNLIENIIVNDEKVSVKKSNIDNEPQLDINATEEVIIIKDVKSKPEKAPRKKKEHVYEDIDDYIPPEILIAEEEEHIKAQNEKIKSELFEISIDESESDTEITSKHLLAPMSSVESASSEESGRRKPLTPLSEEELTEDSSAVIDDKIINTIDNNNLNDVKTNLNQPIEESPQPEHEDKDEEDDKEEQIEAIVNENEDAIAENISFNSPSKIEIDPRWSTMK